MKKYIPVFLIFLLIIGGGGAFLFLFPKSKEEKELWTELSVEDPAVKLLYERANPSDNVLSLMDVYQKRTFTNEFILGAAFVDYLKENDAEYVSEEEITKRVHKIFGDITFAHDSGYIVNDLLCAFYYDKATKSYTHLTGCDGSMNSYLSRVLVSAKKSETEYVLTEKLIYVKSNWDEVMGSEDEKATLRVYSDVNETKILKEISYDWEESMPVFNVLDYLDTASTYEYHFQFDGENYVYTKLEKVN